MLPSKIYSTYGKKCGIKGVTCFYYPMLLEMAVPRETLTIRFKDPCLCSSRLVAVAILKVQYSTQWFFFNILSDRFLIPQTLFGIQEVHAS